MPPRSKKREQREEHTARGRIAAAAEQHGWQAVLNTGQVWNVRIYERGNTQLLIGFRRDGSVTGANRGYAIGISTDDIAATGAWTDELTHRDQDKAEQVLAWLTEDS